MRVLGLRCVPLQAGDVLPEGCVDLNTDRWNCGACGNVCAAGVALTARSMSEASFGLCSETVVGTESKKNTGSQKA